MGTYSVFEKSFFQLSWNLGVVLMAVGYVAVLTLLVQKENWKPAGQFLNKLWAYIVFGLCLLPTEIVFHYQ